MNKLKFVLSSAFAAILRSRLNIGQFMVYVLYLFCRNIVCFIERLLVRVNLNKENVACRKRILLRQYPNSGLFDMACAWDFFGIGSHQVACDYVLSDNVTLYCFHNNTAVFVEHPQAMDIYNTQEHPFFLETQYSRSTHVITMSLENAHTLAKRLGNPHKRTICLHHTGRAGSTLLAQIFNKTGKVQVLSMPDCYTRLQNMYASHPEQEKRQMALTMTRLLFKPVDKYKHTSLILLKLKSTNIRLGPLLQSVPWMQSICLYRNGLPSVQSFERHLHMVNCDLILRVKFLRKLFFYMNMYPYFGQGNLDLVDSYFLVLTWRYFSVLSHVVSFKKKFNMLVYKFEDLIAKPDEFIQDIFGEFGLSKDLVPIAKTALDHHSQQNSKALGGPGKYNSTEYKGQTKVKAEAIARNFKLPSLDSDIRV